MSFRVYEIYKGRRKMKAMLENEDKSIRWDNLPELFCYTA